MCLEHQRCPHLLHLRLHNSYSSQKESPLTNLSSASSTPSRWDPFYFSHLSKRVTKKKRKYDSRENLFPLKCTSPGASQDIHFKKKSFTHIVRQVVLALCLIMFSFCCCLIAFCLPELRRRRAAHCVVQPL